MNIFFSSLSGQDQTQSQHYLRILKNLGHNVFFFSTPTIKDENNKGFFITNGFDSKIDINDLIKYAGFTPDLFLYVEPYGIIPRGLDKANFPTACIICDTHLGLEERIQTSLFFDYVFLYHKNYIKYFTKHPKNNVLWHPYACDLTIFNPKSKECEYEYYIAFIGQLQTFSDRKKVITDLSKNFKINEQRFYSQLEIPLIYSVSKIVLNLPLSDDLNFRTFEAISCGALLITKRINNGQEFLFQENVHYVAFSDYEELEQKVFYYLNHPEERLFIANNGLKLIKEKHSLEFRIQDLLDQIFLDTKFEAPIRFMDDYSKQKQYAWLYQHWSLVEAGIHNYKSFNSKSIYHKIYLFYLILKSLYKKFKY